jgi:hypothetical protein
MLIIQQIVSKLTENVFKCIEKKGMSSIGDTISSLESIVSESVLEMINAVIKEMDDSLCAGAKALRKQDGITIKERNVSRTILTELGELTYQRTYFKLKDGTFDYLLDRIIGVEEFERMSKEFVAKLLNSASTNSYQKAIDSTKQPVSKQMIHNRLLALKELAVDVERVKETPETLDLFADEDHVHLNPRGNAIVPLVTITEGIDQSDPKRHKTIHPMHIAAYGMSQDAFNENVLAVLDQRYDLSQVKRIYLHADGGNWIVGLQQRLPKCSLVMDGYHLEKNLRSFLRLEGAKPYAQVIRDTLKDEEGYKKFEFYCNKILEKQSSDAAKQKVLDFKSYCRNHWNPIVLRMRKETCGSCTESQVSHVLSGRLSRNPIAWSRKGLSKMTMLIAYSKNGCEVTAENVQVSPRYQNDTNFRNQGYSKYFTYACKQVAEMMEYFRNYDFCPPENHSYGKVDATYIIRKSMGSMRSLSELIN